MADTPAPPDAAPGTPSGGPPGAPAPARRCPTCGQPTVQRYRPFCSRRCADIDLNRWLEGVYAVPAVEDEDGPDDGTPPGAGR